jgi:hypothetical protein
MASKMAVVGVAARCVVSHSAQAVVVDDYLPLFVWSAGVAIERTI